MCAGSGQAGRVARGVDLDLVGRESGRESWEGQQEAYGAAKCWPEQGLREGGR